MWGINSFHSVNDEITRVPGSSNLVPKEVYILLELNPHRDYVACEEEHFVPLLVDRYSFFLIGIH